MSKGASQDPTEHPHAPAGTAQGGQFTVNKGGGGNKAKPSSGHHPAPKPPAHHDNGTLSFDPHSNHGTGYGSPHGDARVHGLQEALTRLGIHDGSGKALKDDGKLGPKTTAAVKEAQKRLGLPQDGRVTPALLAKIKGLKVLPAKRSEGDVDLSARGQGLGMERRIYPAQFEVRASPNGTGGTKYSLRGYATVYGTPYSMLDKFGEYEERVLPGSGKKTLSEYPDVVLRMDHAGIPMARTKNGTLHLTEDSTGLGYDAPELNGSRQDIHDTLTAVEDRIVDESSFQFKTTRQQWSDDYSKRDIGEYSLNRGDVSIVTFGASPTTGEHTRLSMRAQDFDTLDEGAAFAIYQRLEARFRRDEDISPGRLAELLNDLDRLDDLKPRLLHV